MTRFLMIMILGLTVTLASIACAGQTDSSGEATGSAADSGMASMETPGKVEMAARIAKEIQADPENTEAILQRHGKTEEEFEAMLYEIAQDPKLSQAYTQALNR